MPEREVNRYEDISFAGYLRLVRETDGDIIVVVYSEDEMEKINEERPQRRGA